MKDGTWTEWGWSVHIVNCEHKKQWGSVVGCREAGGIAAWRGGGGGQRGISVKVGNLAVAISNLGADLLKDDWGMMMCDAVMQTGDGK